MSFAKQVAIPPFEFIPSLLLIIIYICPIDNTFPVRFAIPQVSYKHMHLQLGKLAIAKSSFTHEKPLQFHEAMLAFIYSTSYPLSYPHLFILSLVNYPNGVN